MTFWLEQSQFIFFSESLTICPTSEHCCYQTNLFNFNNNKTSMQSSRLHCGVILSTGIWVGAHCQKYDITFTWYALIFGIEKKIDFTGQRIIDHSNWVAVCLRWRTIFIALRILLLCQNVIETELAMKSRAKLNVNRRLRQRSSSNIPNKPVNF